jgi:OOP family OmpA-OmpF porin
MKRRPRIALVLALAILAASGAARAEVTGLKLTLSPYAGITLWDQLVQFEDSPIYGGRVGLMFGRWVGLEGTYGYSPTHHSVNPGGDTNATHIGGDLVINLTKPYRVVPYIFAGWSMLTFDPDRQNGAALGKQSFFGGEAGAGLRMRMAERLDFRIDIRDVAVDRDAPHPVNWTNNVIWSAGLQLAIGGHSADDDHDGVPNHHDKCPNTPAGAFVDKNGCPTDADGDGIFDGLDQCANTPHGAKVDMHGCPLDTDGDGVFDGLDQCANTPHGAKVDARGCPVDSDGDGVPDGIDQCTNTPSGATVDANGCPIDTDGDGVPDGLDQCPGTARDARVDKNGCPIEVNEKETQLLDTGMIRLDNVQFESAKWDIKPESFAVLDEVGGILSQWPQLQIEIGGHTDARGTDKYNQELSDKRAHAVMEYLTSKFSSLNANQYTAKGYGESKPIADNSNEIGRAQNRRVEFKVLNRETLRKEIERRKTLKKEGN